MATITEIQGALNLIRWQTNIRRSMALNARDYTAMLNAGTAPVATVASWMTAEAAQWQGLCRQLRFWLQDDAARRTMIQNGLAALAGTTGEPTLASVRQDRVQLRDAADALAAAPKTTADECLAALAALGTAAGPLLSIDDDPPVLTGQQV